MWSRSRDLTDHLILKGIVSAYHASVLGIVCLVLFYFFISASIWPNWNFYISISILFCSFISSLISLTDFRLSQLKSIYLLQFMYMSYKHWKLVLNSSGWILFNVMSLALYRFFFSLSVNFPELFGKWCCLLYSLKFSFLHLD